MIKYLITKDGKPTNGLFSIIIAMSLAVAVNVATTGDDEKHDVQIQQVQVK